MKWYRSLACMAVAIGALLAGTSPEARAAFVMTLDDLSTPGIDVTVEDGSPNDEASAEGTIAFTDSVGNFATQATVGLSKPTTGSSTEAAIELVSLNIEGAAGAIQLALTDTDFILPGQDIADILTLANTLEGNTPGGVTAQGFVDFDNTEFGTQFSTSLQGPFTGVFDDTTLSTLDSPGNLNPFSLTEIVTIAHTGADQTSIVSKQLTATVPEPGTLLLLGIGLLGLAGSGWRRRHN